MPLITTLLRTLPPLLKRRWYILIGLAAIEFAFSLSYFLSYTFHSIAQGSYFGPLQIIPGLLAVGAVVWPTRWSRLMLWLAVILRTLLSGLIVMLAMIFMGPMAFLMAPDILIVIILLWAFIVWWRDVKKASAQPPTPAVQ